MSGVCIHLDTSPYKDDLVVLVSSQFKYITHDVGNCSFDIGVKKKNPK
jgi:hypothetical protein